MAAVFTRRLGSVFPSAAGSFPLFTTSSTQHVIIRDLTFVCRDAAAQQVIFSISGPGGFFLDLVANGEVAPLTTFHVDLRQELLAGESLGVFSTSSLWSAIATGYVFNP